MENLRRRALRLGILSGILLVLGFVSFLPAPVLGLPLFLAGILLSLGYARARKAFSLAYKQETVLSVLKEVFDDVTFTPSAGLSRDVLDRTELVDTGDRFQSEDLLTATYRGISFTQSDVHIETAHHNSDGTGYTTLFEGRWILLRFPKTFSGNLQIMTRNFSAGKQKGGLLFRREERLSPVELENEAFNRAFTVRGDDQHEAFYLLTPPVMEDLLALKAAFDCPLMLLFTGGDLHIAVDDRSDAFEPRLFGSADKQNRERIREEAAVITRFIRGLDLPETARL